MILYEELAPKENADDILIVRKNYFSDNDEIKKDDEVIELETSKTAIIVTAKKKGFIENIYFPGDKVKVGEPIFRIHDKPLSIKTKVENKKNLDPLPEKYSLSKSAQQYVKDKNLDISNLKLKGLISLKTLIKLLEEEGGSDNSLELKNNVTKTENSNLSLAKINEIKALTSVNKYGLVSTIKTNINIVTDSNINLLLEIIFESSRLLNSFPLLNAYFKDNSIHLHDLINIGFAVDIDDGLKVIQIPNTNKKNYVEIKKMIDILIEKYLSKRLEIADITNSTFTITDLSQFGVSSFVPLVNANQSAMLGISSSNEVTNQVEISLSFDHRVTEGKYVAEFLSKLKERIQATSSKKSQISKKCHICQKTLREDEKMSGIGLIKTLKHDGKEDLICSVCLSGW